MKKNVSAVVFSIIAYMLLVLVSSLIIKRIANQYSPVLSKDGFLTFMYGLVTDHWCILAVILNLALFYVWFVILASFDLSFIYPIMAGAVYVSVMLMGVFYFGEPVTWNMIVGGAAILAGILTMSL